MSSFEDKTLMEKQVAKIFSIIETSDNQEIAKIALETLSNKIYEDKNSLFFIFKYLLKCARKGNLKVIQETHILIQSMFEDLDSSFFRKLLISEIFREGLENLLSEDERIFSIDTESSIKKLDSINILYFDSFDKFDLNSIENLYSDKNDEDILIQGSTQTGLGLGKMDIEILFPEKDEIREEVEMSLNTSKKGFPSMNQKNNIAIVKNQIKISDFCEKHAHQYKFSEFLHKSNEGLIWSNAICGSIKKRRLDPTIEINKIEINQNYAENFHENLDKNIFSHSNEKELLIKELIFNPLNFIIEEILKLNSHHNWKTRLCSITLLNYLKSFLNENYFTFYKVIVSYYSPNLIEDIKISNLDMSENVINSMKENIVSRMVLTSLVDKVVDFNSEDFICIFKELNLKFCTFLLTEVELKSKLNRKIHEILNQILNNKHNDWQCIYAILLYCKDVLTEDECNESKDELKVRLFYLICKLMGFDSEEIVNLTTLILDKLLEKKTILHFIDKNKLNSVFGNFLKLIHTYDDIGIGVKYYFNCLYNFIDFFKLTGELNKYQQLIPLLENDLIFFSLNKISSVRLKYFQVINDLISCQDFKFSHDFIQKNTFLAFQGLCIEDDKQLLKTQKQLLETIISKEEYTYIFFNNSKIFSKLLFKNNIKDLKYFYIPSNEKYEKSEMGMTYSAFFKNDMEVEAVRINYERKLFFLIPVFALVMKERIEFTKLLFGYLKIDLNPNSITLSRELLIVLKIYYYYLELISKNENKILIFNDECLKKLSDQTSLNEMYYKFSKKKEYEKFLFSLKIFLDFISSRYRNEAKDEILKLFDIYNTLHDKWIIKSTEVLDIVKDLFEKIKPITKENECHNLRENFKYLTDSLNNLDELTNSVKGNIRGFASIAIFIHSYFINMKIEKVSSVANPLLNCLKINDKNSKIFAVYLLKLLFTMNNPDVVNKILNTFIENSISIYTEEISKIKDEAMSENENDGTYKFCPKYKPFLPIKYFFSQFSKYEKYEDIHRIVNEYKNSLPENCESKLIILIFMLTFIKNKVRCIDWEKFDIQFLNYISNESKKKNRSPKLLNLVSIIILQYEKMFSDQDWQFAQKYESKEEKEEYTNTILNKILSAIYSEIIKNSDHVEESDFKTSILINYFQLLEKLVTNEKFLIISSHYLFDVLKFINHKNEELRSISISLFSKIMKTLTLMKMDKDWDKLFKSSQTSKPSALVKTLLNQNIQNPSNTQEVRLKENLRSYQITGVNWLTSLGDLGLGVALCDDMGLGKTVQTLVAIVNSSRVFQRKNNKNPINLIICPNTLILNWINEGKKFFSEKEVKFMRIEDEIKESKKLDCVEIFVTSYDKIRDTELFTDKELYYLVLDEAHIIKNPKTKLYQSIRTLSSEKRIILTGTPIQNNVMELWALFDFLMPGFLGSQNDFEIKYHKKIHSGIKKLNLEEKLQENIFKTSLLEIRKRIKPFVLRRLKQDVLKELPEKIIQDYMCEMTPIQKELYTYWENIYEGPQQADAKGKKVTKKTQSVNSTSNSNNTLKVIDSLRKVCNFPGLLLNDENFSSIPQFKKLNKDTLKNFYSSGKLKSLSDLLISLGFESYCSKNNISLGSSTSEISENKILIFSQYKMMVDKISDFLKQEFSGIKTLKITSDLSSEERIDTVSNFNSDPSYNILILTTSIGGLGLSLTSANIVIMYDHDWNPMKDLQAMDRAHRIGQKKTVEIFRLITAGSIEEKLINLQTFKKYIANNVVDRSNMHESNVNVNTFMESLEEFSTDKSQNKKRGGSDSKNKKPVSGLKAALTNLEREKEDQDEVRQLEYLKKFI
jgi:SNF2 family DNA or RNA helicase